MSEFDNKISQRWNSMFFLLFWDKCDLLDIGTIRDDNSLRPFQSDYIFDSASMEDQCYSICATNLSCTDFKYDEHSQLCTIYDEETAIYAVYLLETASGLVCGKKFTLFRIHIYLSYTLRCLSTCAFIFKS